MKPLSHSRIIMATEQQLKNGDGLLRSDRTDFSAHGGGSWMSFWTAQALRSKDSFM